jgi:hypothetical protein
MIMGVVSIITAQEAYFSIGRNFTTYDYTNSLGESNPNVNGSSGVSYEVGYVYKLSSSFGLDIGITLNEFNATGGNYVNNYSWETNYLGLQGVLKYRIFGKNRFCSNIIDGSALYFNAGLNLNHIVNGQQKINGQTFMLTENNEFNSFFIQPLIGLDLSCLITDSVSIGLGYHFSKNLPLSDTGSEKLSFINSQLQFNMKMSF